MKAILLATAAILLHAFAAAQGARIHHFVMAPVADGHGVKLAHEAVLSVDPEALVSFDGARVKIKSEAGSSALLQALNANGDITYRSDEMRASMAVGEGAAFPKLVDTGDPAGDAARYATTKAAWIEANPDAYQRLIESGPTVPLEEKHP